MSSLRSPSGLRAGRGRLADPAFRWVITLTGLSVLVVLGLMIVSTSLDSLPVFQKEGFRFFTGTEWNPGTSRTDITGTYGALPFIVGTLITSGIAIVIAVPLSIGIALYLTQVAGPRVRKPLTYMVELLAAVPSVVYALWGLKFFAPNILRPIFERITDTIGAVIPFFSGPVIGTSYATAGVVLSIMILPIITAVTREVFATVPESEVHAAYGLGATRWEVMRHVVVYRSRPGIIGATMLGLGRALGETIAVTVLIGGSQNIGKSIFAGGESMAGVIASTFQEATPEGVKALIAIGVALFLITVIVNVIARAIVWATGGYVTGDAAV